jgi:hypothetical protein
MATLVLKMSVSLDGYVASSDGSSDYARQIAFSVGWAMALSTPGDRLDSSSA